MDKMLNYEFVFTASQEENFRIFSPFLTIIFLLKRKERKKQQLIMSSDPTGLFPKDALRETKILRPSPHQLSSLPMHHSGHNNFFP